MPDSSATVVTDYLRRLAAPLEAQTDAELLAHYGLRRNSGAFALLVRRHGPMVLGVCRRMLGNTPDADDAFQATFLALSQSARKPIDSVPGWLYRVAVRTSRKALHRYERSAPDRERADPADPLAAVEWRDVRRLLDEELSRLPAKWRTPLVLCYLEGRTRDEAAQQLKWSLRTLHRRLDEGRSALRERLTRRSVGPVLLGAAVLSTDELRATVPPALARNAVALANRGIVVPSTVRALVPNLSPWGGLAMKATVSAIVLVGGFALLLGARQPVGADPVPRSPSIDGPTVLALAPVKKERPPADPLAEKVKEAQEKAIKYLKSERWETNALQLQAGGGSALAVLALLETGLKADDEAIVDGLKFLRTVEPKNTYVVGLQTQALCKANRKEDADAIKRNVKWLEEAAVWDGGALLGWTYTAAKARADNSNTRYAIAGLHAAHRAGFKTTTDKFWDAVRDMYIRMQRADGGWGYIGVAANSTHTMTFSGVLGLTLANDAIGSQDKSAERSRQAGFDWIANEFRLQVPQHTLYNFDVVAALGRATERKDFGTKDKKRDWYREGAEWLLKNQQLDGRWQPSSAGDNLPVISTSFALRFLASRPD